MIQNDLLEKQLKSEINELNSEKSDLLTQMEDSNSVKSKLQETLVSTCTYSIGEAEYFLLDEVLV